LEPGKNEKKSFPLTPPAKNLKGKKKQGALGRMLVGHPQLCFQLAAQNFSSPKEFITIFGLDYIPNAKKSYLVINSLYLLQKTHYPPSLV
jgi:hypothetical protein